MAMMKIGLISDTHIPVAARSLPIEVAHALSDVDVILHAGDIYSVETLDWLETIASVLAARGNGDDQLKEDRRLKDSHTIQAEEVRIGLSHGLALPPDPWRPMATIMQREFGGDVDVFVCGDTHVASIEFCDGVLLVNPGSPTLPHNLLGKLGTVGTMEINGNRITVRVVRLGTEYAAISVPGEFTYTLRRQADSGGHGVAL